MIYKFKRIAIAIQVFRLPSLSVGLISLTSLIVIVIFSASDPNNQFVIPCIAGFLWGLCTYSFIVTFKTIPEKPSTPLRLFGKLKHTITLFWYWLLGVIFLGSTVTIIIITIRMVLIWWKK